MYITSEMHIMFIHTATSIYLLIQGVQEREEESEYATTDEVNAVDGASASSTLYRHSIKLYRMYTLIHHQTGIFFGKKM